MTRTATRPRVCRSDHSSRRSSWNNNDSPWWSGSAPPRSRRQLFAGPPPRRRRSTVSWWPYGHGRFVPLPPPLRAPRSDDSRTPASLSNRVRDSLAADVASVLGNDHAVELRTERGGRRKALIKAAREADLLVVDAPRALTVGPMFAHRLVYSAACPVVVMPPRISGEPPSWLQRLARSAGRQAVRSLGTSGRAGTPPRTSPPS